MSSTKTKLQMTAYKLPMRVAVSTILQALSETDCIEEFFRTPVFHVVKTAYLQSSFINKYRFDTN